MKKLGEFFSKLFKSRAFWWFIACILISLFIWLVGPYIAIYNMAPLGIWWVDLLLTGFLFLIWFVVHFKNHIKEHHFFQHHPKKESYNEEGIVDKREKKRIRSDFKKLTNFLLKHSREKKWRKETLYDLPWYLIVGEQGAGKTSLLRDAELHLTYQSYNHITHRTATFQWLLAEEGVFIDLPHTFCWQKNAQQKFNWQVFLKYLKKARVRRPLNGVILVINLQELAEGKLNDWQESIRVRTHELQQKLSMQIPIYVVFTHTDTISGFPEFVMRFNDKERAEVMGVSFGSEDAIPLDQFPFHYDEFVKGLNMRLKRDLDQEWMNDKSNQMYYFPMQMAALKESLSSFAKTLFAERRYFTTMVWRGLYFVSNGIHSSSRYDVILDESAFDTAELPKAFRNRRYFIEGMFRNAILKESEFVGVQPYYERHYAMMRRLKLSGALGVTALISSVWATSMVKHETYDNTVLQAIQAGGLNPATLSELYHQGSDVSGSFWLHLGLLGYPSTVNAVKNLYAQSLIQNYLPTILGTLHAGLQKAVDASNSNNNSMNNVENLYDWLSSYLMFNELKEMNENQVLNILGNDSRTKDLLTFGFPAQNLDQNLVQTARQALWNSPIYMQAYLLLKLNAMAGNQETFAITGSMDADSTEVFSNLNQATVPVFFTKQGYKGIYEKQASNSLNQVTNQSWVLGNSYHVDTSSNQLSQYQAQMDNLYWTDYMNAWDSALGQINIASFQSLQQEIDVLSTLTQKNSPLLTILNTVEKNSDYGTTLNQDMSKAGVSGTSSASSGGGGGAGSASLSGDADNYIQSETNNMVTNHYLPLTNLLNNSSGQGAPIQNIQASLVALQQYLQGIANSSNPGLSAYSAASAIFAGQADKSLTSLSAEAAQAPVPVSRWLNQIVNNTYAIIFASANQYLSTQWQANVSSFYQQALADRFPFSNSSSEVTIQDFSNFFKPGGVEDSFVKKYLAPFLTTDNFGHTEWNNVNNIAFSSNGAITTEITAAQNIRNTFFGGTAGALNFTITPGDTSVDKTIISYDGKSVTVNGDNEPGVAMMWPPQNTDGTVNLTYHRMLLSDETQNFFGPWGIFHLLQASNLVRSKYGSQYQVTTTYDGLSVSFTLSANSVDNPFDLRLLRNYSCPSSF